MLKDKNETDDDRDTEEKRGLVKSTQAQRTIDYGTATNPKPTVGDARKVISEAEAAKDKVSAQFDTSGQPAYRPPTPRAYTPTPYVPAPVKPVPAYAPSTSPLDAELRARRDAADARTAAKASAATIAPLERAGAQGYSAAQARLTPDMVAAEIDRQDQAEFRAREIRLADLLQDRIEGKAPSVAELQLRRSMGENTSRLAGMAASLRGSSAGSNLSQVLRAQSLSQGSLAGKAAELRAGEQERAEGALGGLVTAGRGQDIGLATSQAQLLQEATRTNYLERGENERFNVGATNAASQFTAGQQNESARLNAQLAAQRANEQATLEQRTNEANLDSALKTRAQSDAAWASAAGLSKDIYGTDVAAKTSVYGTDVAAKTAAERLAAEQVMQQKQLDTMVKLSPEASGNFWRDQAVGAGKDWLKSAGTATLTALLSDRRAKRDVSDGGGAVDRALAKLRPKRFRYRDPADGPGLRVGVMAQDLEASGLGRALVSEGADGRKRIDGGKGLGLALAGLGRLADRVKRLEARS